VRTLSYVPLLRHDGLSLFPIVHRHPPPPAAAAIKGAGSHVRPVGKSYLIR
jgi:hypothetical protein